MRTLVPKNFRIVCSGDSRGSSEYWVEYVVADDDLTEPPKHTDRVALNPQLSLDDLWLATTANVKTAEGIV